MRKGWKIFWIVCASLFGLGIVLCIAGGVMGATMSTVQQAFWDDYGAFKIYRTHTEQTVERVDEPEEYVEENTFEDGSGIDDGIVSNLDGMDVLDVYASVEGIEELDVEITYLAVEIVEGTNDEIVIAADGIPEHLQDKLKVVQDRDELKIETRESVEWKKYALEHEGDLRLLIQIPKDKTFREVSLGVGAGVLNAEKINAKELNVGVGAGAAYITDFTADQFELGCGLGEASVSGKVTRESKIECGIGTVNYHATGSQEDYDYKLECGAGTLRVGNEEYSGLINERKIQNQSDILMEVECGIGEVNITFEEE